MVAEPVIRALAAKYNNVGKCPNWVRAEKEQKLSVPDALIAETLTPPVFVGL